jgi:glucosamine--fructose-6-phosphate aminotransferase (isomerizing)
MQVKSWQLQLQRVMPPNYLHRSYLFEVGLRINPISDELVLQASALVKNAQLVADAVNSCNRDHEIVTLGRGFSYPNAREAALKIQETSKISVQGLSMADYMHGPISALTKLTQVIIFMPNGLPASSIKDDVSRIRKDGPKIIWLGNSELAEGDDVIISGAKCSNEIYSSIVDSILLQRFALEFARKNGLDPDSPQGLSKVTLTI